MRATRHASRWLAGAGVLALVGALWTPVATADPPGNNGTIKVDGQAFDTGHPDNEPHVGCLFEIDFYNYEASVTDVTMEFALHPPTGDEVIRVVTGTLDGDDASGANEAGLDGHFEVNLGPDLVGVTPHEQQGYHIKLTITAEDHDGENSVTKYKVFWVTECSWPGTGGVRVTKDVTGTAAPAASTEFAFSLDCEGTEYDETFSLVDGASVSYGFIPDGTSCTLTETNSHGGTVTYRVDGDVDPPPVAFEIDEETVIDVLVTNDFPYTPPTVPPLTVQTTTTTTTTTVPASVLPTEVTQAPSTTAPPTTAAPAEVEGVQLARTGGVNTTLLLVGSLLVLQGVALEVSARRLHRS